MIWLGNSDNRSSNYFPLSQGLANCGLWAKSNPPPISQLCLFVYTLSKAAFLPQWQSCRVATETIRLLSKA